MCKITQCSLSYKGFPLTLAITSEFISMIAQHFCLDKKITSEVDENDASYVRVQYITVGIGVNESQKIIEATQSSKFKRRRPEKGGRGKLTCVGSFYQLDF